MSQEKEEMSDEKQGRVQVNDLPPKLEELTGDKAKEVKGGAGSPVVVRDHIGEEIPQ